MNGTFAVLTLVLGMNDAYSDCREGCLAAHDVESRIAVSQGSLQFKGDVIGREVYVRYDSAHANGPFQSIYGASYSSLGDIWAGFGHAYTMSAAETGLYAEVHAMTGLYFQSGGPDLGGPIEFRSGAEIGYRFSSGWRVAASYDHRSNAEIFALNPGVETVQFRISKPLK
jgi:lipid A 3-O-deacylase